MELLEIENLDLGNNTLTAVFDGLFTEGFIVKTDFSYDEETIEEEEGEKQQDQVRNEEERHLLPVFPFRRRGRLLQRAILRQQRGHRTNE